MRSTGVETKHVCIKKHIYLYNIYIEIIGCVSSVCVCVSFSSFGKGV